MTDIRTQLLRETLARDGVRGPAADLRIAQANTYAARHGRAVVTMSARAGEQVAR